MPKSKSRRSPQRRPQRQRRAPAPVVPPPTAPGLRGVVERRSAPVLRWLSARPKVLLPLVSVALLIGGFVAPVGFAVPMLLLLVLVVGWLTYLSWPAVDRGGRAVRSATLLMLVVAVVVTVAEG